jgi:hypothetical protein
MIGGFQGCFEGSGAVVRNGVVGFESLRGQKGQQRNRFASYGKSSFTFSSL